MTTRRCGVFALIAVCALLLSTTGTAKAQIGVTRTPASWIGVGIVAIGAGIGICIYYAAHHAHTLIGCALSGPNGLELQSCGDPQTYALIGEVADIKPGDRVSVFGKKEKKKVGASRQFLVEKLNKDYGACMAHPAT